MVTSVLEQPEETYDPVTQKRLAEAQRDVAQYLKQREGAASPPSDSIFEDRQVGSANATMPPPPYPVKRVIFNDGPDTPGDDSATNSSRDAAARQADDLPEISPLFRDPAEEPKVKSFEEGLEQSEDVRLAPDRLRQLLVDLRRELYIEGARSDQPIKQLLPIAAMAMVDPDAAINPEAIPDLTAKERELLGALQTFFRTLAQRLDEDGDVEEVIAQGVRELRQAVIQEPVLTLPTLSMCYRVEGFGKYEPFDHYRFLAQSEQRVIIYVEVDDFTSEPTEQGQWITELSQQVTIYEDRDGIPVWRSGDMQTAVDRAQKKRHDFFLLQIITLPKALSVGKYHLKVRVRDEKSGAEAEESLEFEMVADPKLAVRVP